MEQWKLQLPSPHVLKSLDAKLREIWVYRSYIMNVKKYKLRQLWHATHATSFLQTIRRGTPIRLKTTQPALPPNHQSHAMVRLTSSVAGEALVTLTGCGGCFCAGLWEDDLDDSLWDHWSEFHASFCTKSGPVCLKHTLAIPAPTFWFGIQTPPNSLGELRALCWVVLRTHFDAKYSKRSHKISVPCHGAVRFTVYSFSHNHASVET